MDEAEIHLESFLKNARLFVASIEGDSMPVPHWAQARLRFAESAWNAYHTGSDWVAVLEDYHWFNDQHIDEQNAYLRSGP